jgi:magnesium-transporting ATPase (P-type)
VAALKKSLAPQCWVKRDNEWKKIEARDLVPGDVVEIKASHREQLCTNIVCTVGRHSTR